MRIGKRTHGGNYPQCHFVHKKFQITWPGIKHSSPQWEVGDFVVFIAWSWAVLNVKKINLVSPHYIASEYRLGTVLRSHINIPTAICKLQACWIYCNYVVFHAAHSFVFAWAL
jgi:hypothetical protein